MLSKYTKDWYARYTRYLDARYGAVKEKPMERINMNKMASIVAAREQGDQVNIAQIKEVLRIFLEELSAWDDEYILEVVKRYR